MAFSSLMHLSFGLILLLFGAELLIKKAYFLSQYLGIKPFFVGAFVLGLGTSLPEWFVSVLSSLKEFSNLAITNVIGSNIFNILVVLGLVFLSPISQSSVREAKKDIFFLLIASFILIFFFKDSFFSKTEGFILLFILFSYLLLNFFVIGGKEKPNKKLRKRPSGNIWYALLVLALGFALLIFGSEQAITGAKAFGEQIGLSERLIGLLILSIGTGLPELSASLVAIYKGQKDMAIGTIVGSNIFNIFGVLSTSIIIAPSYIESQIRNVDTYVLLVSQFLLITLFIPQRMGNRIKKIFPVLFLGAYIAYFMYLLKS